MTGSPQAEREAEALTDELVAACKGHTFNAITIAIGSLFGHVLVDIFPRAADRRIWFDAFVVAIRRGLGPRRSTPRRRPRKAAAP